MRTDGIERKSLKEEIEEQESSAAKKDAAEETKAPNESMVEEGDEAPETEIESSEIQLTVEEDDAPSIGAVHETIVAQSPMEKSVR